MSALVGRKEIVGYSKRSWKTVMLLVTSDKFPARKINGIWESTTELIDKWRENKILSIAKD